MKNKATSIILLAVFLSVFSGCKKGGDIVESRCEDLSNDYTAKLNAFVAVQNKANCTAFITSLDVLVDKCAILTAAEKKEYKESRDAIDCSDF
ncbi:hypothetical protein GVN16_10885 [Emticicia sp. CRIBPO]|uniref:hypothetical protein n=1 Tax=Emticicia sp. CRIBPO TaxID=2683258 RepID=UPI00141234AA|nr:hypothetical protein [Emticicia sp. CRIBPO]NBA86270.1 hypothetical protein [Emticicia sp. CRIBPO]